MPQKLAEIIGQAIAEGPAIAEILAFDQPVGVAETVHELVWCAEMLQQALAMKIDILSAADLIKLNHGMTKEYAERCGWFCTNADLNAWWMHHLGNGEGLLIIPKNSAQGDYATRQRENIKALAHQSGKSQLEVYFEIYYQKGP